MCWYPLKNNTGSLREGADLLCELLLRCVRFTRLGACRADSESVRKTAFIFVMCSTQKCWCGTVRILCFPWILAVCSSVSEAFLPHVQQQLSVVVIQMKILIISLQNIVTDIKN